MGVASGIAAGRLSLAGAVRRSLVSEAPARSTGGGERQQGLQPGSLIVLSACRLAASGRRTGQEGA